MYVTAFSRALFSPGDISLNSRSRLFFLYRYIYGGERETELDAK